MTDTTAVLQLAREANCNPQRRMTDGSIVWHISSPAIHAMAAAPFGSEAIADAHQTAKQANLGLQQHANPLSINAAATIGSKHWRERQLPYVSGGIVKLGRICSRLVEFTVIPAAIAEHPAHYQRLTAESLCLAALVGYGETAMGRSSPVLLYRSLNEILQDIFRYPDFSAKDWRTVLVLAGNNSDTRERIMRMHKNTGKSVGWCYQLVRKEINRAQPEVPRDLL